MKHDAVEEKRAAVFHGAREVSILGAEFYEEYKENTPSAAPAFPGSGGQCSRSGTFSGISGRAMAQTARRRCFRYTVPMILRPILACVLALGVAGAQAQLRSLPAEAKRGEMRHVQDMLVEIDGKRLRLAPGAQIRGPDNLIVLPMALPPGSLVKYTLDAQANVFRAWILTPQEAAQPDAKK